MSQGDLLNWIGNQGFAIAVAAYLLIRIEHKLDRILEKLS